MNNTKFDFNTIAPANPELAITINPDADNIEDLFGITDQRNHELISALRMLLDANNLKAKDLSMQERYIASFKLAKTPNELAWFAARTTAVIGEMTNGFRVESVL